MARKRRRKQRDLQAPIIIPCIVDGKCSVAYYLSADNDSTWKVIWLVREFKNDTCDEPREIRVETYAPQSAYSISQFEFDVKAKCCYQISRKWDDVKDTALGDEHILRALMEWREDA